MSHSRRSRQLSRHPISPPSPSPSPPDDHLPREAATEDELDRENSKSLQRLKQELFEKEEQIRMFEETSRLRPPVTPGKAENEREEEKEPSEKYEREFLQEGESSGGIRLPRGKQRFIRIQPRQRRSRSVVRSKIVREELSREGSGELEGIHKQMKSSTRKEKKTYPEVRIFNCQMRQMGEEEQKNRAAHESESSSPAEDSEPSIVSWNPEPSQVINAACIRSGLGYTQWLGEYVNGTVLVFGGFSLRELKAEPCENCHMRGLACQELTELDPFHGELPKNSCCGWCISESGTEVSEDQRRQRSQAALRQKRFDFAKAADLAMTNGDVQSSLPEPDGHRPLFRFFLREDGLSRYEIQKFLEERFTENIVVNFAEDGVGYVIKTESPIPQGLIEDLVRCCTASRDSLQGRYYPQRPELHHHQMPPPISKMRSGPREESPKKNYAFIERDPFSVPGAPPPPRVIVRRDN